LLATGFAATLLGGDSGITIAYETIAILLVFGILAGLQSGQVVANQPTQWAELEQRISAYAFMLGVAVLVIGLLCAQKAR